MKGYERYIAINKKLVQGDRVLFSQIGGDGTTRYNPGDYDRVLHYPRIGLYTGIGASHSWLWFVELFERLGFYDIVFLDEDHIKADCLGGLDVLVMSGGDTFAMAEGLGERGAEKLESFIRNGGLYIGSCAGAYLPMNSSKKNLNLFNYANVKITNLTKILPEAKRVPEKFCTPYGCSFIFHPVREAVRLTTNGFTPFSRVESLLAPLYGGPPMVTSDPSQVLATYSGFTDKTLFLVDEELARETLLGKAAVIRKKMGAGHLYLFGPHFEHPHFPVANQLLADAIYWDMRDTPLKKQDNEKNAIILKGEKAKRLIRDIKRELSNSRIVASGMEMMPITWLIGRKIYEPAKIRVFLEAMWVRVKPLEKWEELRIKNGEHEKILKLASDTTILLRKSKKDVEKGSDAVNLAKEIFNNLKRMSMIFLDIYFRTVNGNKKVDGNKEVIAPLYGGLSMLTLG